MIVFSSVSKTFADETAALRDVSFSIEPGEFVCITGHSGSGKTTLMKLLTKEYVPSSGEITFEETPLSSISYSQVHHHRRKIGVIFQDYKLLPEYTIWENIALPLFISGRDQSEIETRVTDLLKLVNLTEKAFSFPKQLSGGEAQRVSIARALASAPSLIFADEPTGNLDPETSQTIARLLYTINQLGTTVLLATHDIEILEGLPKPRHIHLEKGQIVKDTKGAAKPVTKTATKPKEPPKTETKSEPIEAKPEPKEDKAGEKVEAKAKPTESVETLEEPKTKHRFSLPKIDLGFMKKKATVVEEAEEIVATEPKSEKDKSKSEKATVVVEELDEM
jgi:cell division transport system ATP-binding protein